MYWFQPDVYCHKSRLNMFSSFQAKALIQTSLCRFIIPALWDHTHTTQTHHSILPLSLWSLTFIYYPWLSSTKEPYIEGKTSTNKQSITFQARLDSCLHLRARFKRLKISTYLHLCARMCFSLSSLFERPVATQYLRGEVWLQYWVDQTPYFLSPNAECAQPCYTPIPIESLWKEPKLSAIPKGQWLQQTQSLLEDCRNISHTGPLLWWAGRIRLVWNEVPRQ